MTGGARPCRGCQRIRVFLTVALPLIAMIYLQPAVAVRLSHHMPGTAFIGWAVVGAAALVFALRLIHWRRTAHDRV